MSGDLGGRVRPVMRTDHEVLVDIADLLTRSLAQLEHIRHLLEQPTEARSSAEVKTSPRGHDLAVKSYADGFLQKATEDAVSEYAIGMRILADLAKNQWEQTVDALAEARNGNG